MRAGAFELAIVTGSTRTPLPEVPAPGRTYVVAQPGQEFEVLFKCSRMAPNRVYKAQLSVDGRSVGYGMIYRAVDADAGTPVHFKGFLEERGSDGATYRGFQFATSRQDASKAVTSIDGFAEGKLVCKVWEARVRDRHRPPQKHTVPDAATVAALPAGKKFFMAPSLPTAAGAVKKVPRHMGSKKDRHRHKRVGQAPIARIELHYETAATLVLRGVLNPDTNLEYTRIADACTGAGGEQQQEEEEQEDLQQEVGGTAAGPSGRSGTRVPIKRKKQKSCPTEQQELGQQRRKRGRASGPITRDRAKQLMRMKQQLADEAIDLTRWHPRPNDPLLAAKREMKDLECDLTGEEEPVWRESKRQAIEVD